MLLWMRCYLIYLCSDDNGDVSSIDDNRDTNSDCDGNGDGGDW